MMVLSKNGYEFIEAKISEVMGITTQAMQKDSAAQGTALQSIRSKLFELSTVVKTYCYITPDEAPESQAAIDIRPCFAVAELARLKAICKALGQTDLESYIAVAAKDQLEVDERALMAKAGDPAALAAYPR